MPLLSDQDINIFIKEKLKIIYEKFENYIKSNKNTSRKLSDEKI